MAARSHQQHGAPRVVVVTGASAGVGRAIATEQAAHGDRVALLARGHSGLAAAAEEIRRTGGEAITIEVDVADAEQVEQAAAEVEDRLGPIDVWVNVAFSSVFARSWEITPEEYRRITEVSYLGFVHGTLSALRRMRPRDRGTIVQVGSALAYRGIPLQAAYCGAKHAIQGFHESVRCELLHERSQVRVTMAQLPAVNTPQFSWVLARLPHRPQPVPPIYQPEVVARGVRNAIEHPRRRERWIGTSTALTIMANAVAPGILDRYLGRTGFDSQQTADPTAGSPQEATGNLWKPRDTDSDWGSHGRFDDRSISRSPQQWLIRTLDRVFARGR